MNQLILYTQGQPTDFHQCGVALPIAGWWLYTNYKGEHNDFPLYNEAVKIYDTSTKIDNLTGEEVKIKTFNALATFQRIMQAHEAVQAGEPALAVGFTKQEWKEASSLSEYKALLPQDEV